ncbi:MAG: hypothetical protein ACI9G1_004147, partial [Pirellulaceae bacterium]
SIFLTLSLVSIAISVAVEPGLTEIKPVRYRNLTPGKSSLDKVLEEYGQPYSRTTLGTSTVLEFADADYDIALVTITAGRVESIALVPTEPKSLKSVADSFDLNKYSPTAVYDETDRAIGLVIPERGILLGLQNGEELMVQELLLGAVEGESFYLRAEQDQAWRLRRNLDDLKLAEHYGFSRGRCTTLASRYLDLAGESQKALAAAEQGVDASPRLLRARLQLASLMPRFGKTEEAATIADSVLKAPDATEFEKTWAQCIAAAQVLREENTNPRRAVEAMESAIGNLESLLVDSPREIRSLARDVQIRARLNLMDVYATMGAVKRTSLKRMCSSELKRALKNAVEEDGNPILAARIVAHISKLRGQLGWSDLAEENSAVIRALGQRVTSAQDPLLSQALRLEISTALLRISHHAKSVNEIADASAASTNGLKLLEKIKDPQKASSRIARAKGELLYTTGLLHVVSKKDHAAATKFYNQARPWLDKAPVDTGADKAQLGDIWVSVGISSWEDGNRTQAVEDTLRGLKLLKQAVASKAVDRATLHVPYTNLETMYRKLGESDKAVHYRLEIANLKKTRTKLR